MSVLKHVNFLRCACVAGAVLMLASPAFASVPKWMTGAKWFCPADARGSTGLEFMIMTGTKGSMCMGKVVGTPKKVIVAGPFTVTGNTAVCKANRGKLNLQFKVNHKERWLAPITGARCRAEILK